MRAKQRKPERNQRLIASFFSSVPSALSTASRTPEKVVVHDTESRLARIAQSRSAFDERGSSDTSFGSPEINNFRNPALNRYSSNLTGLPDDKRKNSGLFVSLDSDDEKENVATTSGVSRKILSSSPVKKMPLKRSGSSNLFDLLDGQPKRIIKKPTSHTPPPPSFSPVGQSIVSLSDEQRAIVDYVVAKGQNVFFTGSAGTGKSVVLRQLVHELRRKHGQFSVGVTASTGLAACNINGQTLHKFLSIGLGLGSPQDLAIRIKRNGPAKKRWISLKVLIIDEILMIDGKLFTKIDEVAKIIRNSQLPFGGIQIVCTGDFFQLPPVSKTNESEYCFQSPAWNRAITRTITLTQVFRQKGDSELIDMLNSLRCGDLDQAMIAKFHLLSRKVAYNDGIEPTELYPTRQEVKRANETRLRLLPGATHVFRAQDNVSDPQLKKNYDNLMCEELLELKEGSQVMYLKNHPDNIVVNGSIGTVIGFLTDNVWGSLCSLFGTRELIDPSKEFIDLVLFLSGIAGTTSFTDEQRETFSIFPLEWQSKATKLTSDARQMNKNDLLPVVNFKAADGGFTVILVRREEFSVDQVRMTSIKGNVPEKLTRVQLPILLAWAMSIHKAQGQSIDRLRVDLRKIFEKGQVYVALSRATSKEHLEVVNFDHRRIRVADEVRNFYKSLTSHM